MVGILVGGFRYVMSWCNLSVTFDLGSVECIVLPHLKHISPITKSKGLLQLIITCTLT